jgi:rod shape-determining protein MreC
VDEFFGRYRNLSILLAVVFAQIILLGYQVRTDHGSRLLREWTVRIVTPVTKGVRGLTQWAGSAWENYFWLVDTKQDNDRLRRQLAQLKLENVGLKSSLARFEREEQLAAYQQDLASTTILAQVIGKGANSNSREIFISRGVDAGIAAGMPVITPDGIVGKVQASYAGAALVMLISDPEAGVGALLERSRAPGIVKGTGHAQCRLDYVSHEVEVAVGETVYTSGDDRVFPKGLRIGEVVKLDRGTDFQEIQIRPFAQLDRIEEVLVITKGVHQNLPDSPQAQPPQFLMPLPAEEADRLRAEAPAGGEAPAAADAEGSAALAESAAPNEGHGRQTDADRSIAAQQGHRIGYGGPGTVPEFNPERAAAQAPRGSARSRPAAAPAVESPASGDGDGEDDPAVAAAGGAATGISSDAASGSTPTDPAGGGGAGSGHPAGSPSVAGARGGVSGEPIASRATPTPAERPAANRSDPATTASRQPTRQALGDPGAGRGAAGSGAGSRSQPGGASPAASHPAPSGARVAEPGADGPRNAAQP